MSGTDKTEVAVLGGPSVILIDPQLGENIGFTARAMLNCGLTDLRLVRPRDGWPNPDSVPAAAGANEVLRQARVFETAEEAIADLGHVYATTARRRDLELPVVTPRRAAVEMRGHVARGERVGLLFGAERSGLDNHHLVLAEAAVTVPLNPAFSSLNLGQSVLLLAYEWFQAEDDTPARTRVDTGEPLASKALLTGLFRHLDQELETAHFFRVAEQHGATFRALRTLLTRSEPTEQEVRILHGVVSALSGRRLGGKLRGEKRTKGEDE